MRINNNMMAMNTHRQLGAANAGGAKSMEKLSSGMRINRAGDDAAGLAISEKMRGQIRGLNQAAANSQDGISMIQTAEGALNETHAILQRMRELSVQSANDTNVGVDRGEIQKEMNQLTSEINRIGNTTEFNTQKILKGSEESKVTQPALNLKGLGKIADADGSASVIAASSKTDGGETIAATGARVELTAIESTALADLDGLDMTFNFGGQEIVLTIDSSGVADPTVGTDGKTVTVNIAQITSEEDVAIAIKTALEAAIKGNANIDADAYDIEVNLDAAGDPANGQINITSKETGNKSFIDVDSNVGLASSDFATGKDISYTASTVDVKFGALGATDALEDLVGQGITINGKSVEFYNADKGAYKGDADFSVNISSVGDNEDLVAAVINQLGDKVEGVKLSAHGSDADTLVVTSTANGEAGDGVTLTDGVDVAAKTSADIFSAKFQVGANSGQSMQIDIGDMRSLAIGISGNEEGATIAAKNGVEASYVSTKNVSNGTDNDVVEYALDVSTHDKAQAATSVINDAIEKVSSQRSDLGSYQNRLEHTIKNLDTSAENLQASEARIRDVDMAKEMMEQTRQNILAQASTAMLANANQAPQAVLQLLR